MQIPRSLEWYRQKHFFLYSDYLVMETELMSQWEGGLVGQPAFNYRLGSDSRIQRLKKYLFDPVTTSSPKTTSIGGI